MAAPSVFLRRSSRIRIFAVEQHAALNGGLASLEFDELIRIWRADPPVNWLGSKVARISSNSLTRIAFSLEVPKALHSRQLFP
jgi:hypothetical protein